MPGAGFYMTLVCIPLLAFSMVTVFCGWRSDKSGDYPSTGYGAGGYGSDMETGKKGRFAMPWKKNRNAAGAAGGNGSVNGGYGQRSYDDGHNKDSIPLSSRQKVLNAYHSS